MSKYSLYLNDILRAINDITETTKNKNFNSFAKDKNLVDATAMRFQVIGESIKKLPKRLKENGRGINWTYLESLRNIISHAYFKIGPELLWDIVKKEVPKLKESILKMKKF